MRPATPLLLAGLALTASSPIAFATTMRHLDTRSLTLGSSEIVVGAVESTKCAGAPTAEIFTT